LRRVALSFGDAKIGLGRLQLRLDRLELTLRDGDCRLGAFNGGLLLAELRIVLLFGGDRAGALLREVGESRGLLLREHQGGVGLIQLRLGGSDLRALHFAARQRAFDARLGLRNLRIRLIERRFVVAVVQRGDHLAGDDVLVVCDGNRFHVASHLRSQRRLARGDEGVVGRLEMRAVVVPDITRARRNHDKREDRDGQKRAAPPDRRRLIGGRVLLGFVGPFAFLVGLRLRLGLLARRGGGLVGRAVQGVVGGEFKVGHGTAPLTFKWCPAGPWQ
jgi:hypothetical protein